MSTGRVIGIRHRVKKTAEGESRPTQIVLKQGTEIIERTLDDDNAELDFVIGRLPTKWRTTTPEDDLSKLPPHHIVWKKIDQAGDEKVANFPVSLVRKTTGNNFERAIKVPSEYDGLVKGDQVAMVLGGSGDRLAFALANRSKEIGAVVYRIPAFALADSRGKESKDNDALLLVNLLLKSREFFYEVRPRDEKLIRVREALRARTDVMKARIGCEQRLRQSFIGRVFLNEQGHYPEGSIEDAFDGAKANDRILAGLITEEKKAEGELVSACEDLDVYREIFEPIEGLGPMIAARIISAVIDIRRFRSKAKLKAFMGCHVLKDGRFPRQRGGEVANWNPDTRQALYLLGDQFNRRPGSEWGKKFRGYKAKLRIAHPEPIVDANSKKKYTDGHIHRMATWKTLGKFAERLWTDWWKLEGRVFDSPSPENPPTPTEVKPESADTPASV